MYGTSSVSLIEANGSVSLIPSLGLALPHESTRKVSVRVKAPPQALSNRIAIAKLPITYGIAMANCHVIAY